MKRILSTFVLLVMVLSSMIQPAYSAETEDAKADYLNALGMLKGTDNGYELNKSMNRLEAAVMIVRLRGAEIEAIEGQYSHPFEDVPSWASPYVGYMYHYGLTAGKSATEYGAYDSVTLEQYVTFLLRALGYDDGQGDFVWSESIAKAKVLGMDVETLGTFDRGAMVSWTFAVLNTFVKGSSQTLKEQLIAKGVMPKNIDVADAFYCYEQAEISDQPTSYEGLMNSIRKMAYEIIPNKTFNIGSITNIDLDAISEALKNDLMDLPMYSSIINSYELSRYGNQLTVSLTYNITRAEHEAAIAKARSIVSDIITADMSDYEKEKTIHDYIVGHVSYDESTNPAPHVYTVYGALVKQSAVCHGYAESFRYLSYLAGLDVELVVGDAIQNGQRIGHAWNIVVLDGEAYHVDTTWDDPIGAQNNTLSYAYFNVTDAVLSKDHIWNQKAYDKCDATAYNYFYYEGNVVNNTSELKTFLQNGFDDGLPKMVVQVSGDPLSMDSLRDILIGCNIPFNIVFKVDGSNVVTVTKDV